MHYVGFVLLGSICAPVETLYVCSNGYIVLRFVGSQYAVKINKGTIRVFFGFVLVCCSLVFILLCANETSHKYTMCFNLGQSLYLQHSRPQCVFLFMLVE